MQTLRKSLKKISFFEREKINGKYIANKCGRDFLYYALNYYFPERFNDAIYNPTEIDEKKIFGQPTPSWLSWTQVQFVSVPKLLAEHNLSWFINNQKITSYFLLVSAILFSRKSYNDAISEIEECVDNDTVCAIDVGLAWFGLLDHVLFVYGYDSENLYVIDSYKVSILEYEKMDVGRFYFKLPKTVIKKRWTRFGRIWRVTQN
jgi:hypothetical protein